MLGEYCPHCIHGAWWQPAVFLLSSQNKESSTARSTVKKMKSHDKIFEFSADCSHDFCAMGMQYRCNPCCWEWIESRRDGTYWWQCWRGNFPCMFGKRERTIILMKQATMLPEHENNSTSPSKRPTPYRAVGHSPHLHLALHVVQHYIAYLEQLLALIHFLSGQVDVRLGIISSCSEHQEAKAEPWLTVQALWNHDKALIVLTSMKLKLFQMELHLQKQQVQNLTRPHPHSWQSTPYWTEKLPSAKQVQWMMSYAECEPSLAFHGTRSASTGSPVPGICGRKSGK